MEIADLITPENVLANFRASAKKHALQELARKAGAATRLPERMICDVLNERERLGTTGVGMGIAIPHGKLPGLSRLVGMFARLERPIDFGAIDGEPVDLIFLLMAPENAGTEHLKALACVSRLLRDRAICTKLRGTESPVALYALLTEHPTSHAA